MQNYNYMLPNDNAINVVQHHQHQQIQQHQHQQIQQHQHQQIQQHQHQQIQQHHFPSQTFPMQVPAHNLVLAQQYQENVQQYCQPIYFEPLPPVYVKNQLLPPPVMVQMPTTVVVQNESQPTMVLNQPPSNIVVKNNAPTPVYVKQSSPNVVVKNEAPPNYMQGIETCQDTIMSENNMNRQLVNNVGRNIM